jgi:PKD repeat protein
LVNPKIPFTKTEKHKVSLIVVDSFNCTDSAYDEITVTHNLSINLQTVFTPNNDYLNHFFAVTASNSSQIK